MNHVCLSEVVLSHEVFLFLGQVDKSTILWNLYEFQWFLERRLKEWSTPLLSFSYTFSPSLSPHPHNSQMYSKYTLQSTHSMAGAL